MKNYQFFIFQLQHQFFYQYKLYFILLKLFLLSQSILTDLFLTLTSLICINCHQPLPCYVIYPQELFLLQVKTIFTLSQGHVAHQLNFSNSPCISLIFPSCCHLIFDLAFQIHFISLKLFNYFMFSRIKLLRYKTWSFQCLVKTYTQLQYMHYI